MADVLKNQAAKAGKAIKSIDQEISELVEMVREANDRLDEVATEVRPMIDAAKERLRMLLEYRGENWSDDVGYARVVSAGTRISYDSKALDKLIIEDPEQYGWLKQYRSETTVKGGVSVK
jgi:hypothetical protein